MNEGELNLLYRYLDGAITREELISLEDLLRESSEARAMLRSLATIDTKWQQLAADDVLSEPTALAAGESMATARNPAAGAVGSVNSRYAIPMWLTLSAIAASLIVGAFGWFRVTDGTSTESKPGIARVIRVEGEGNTGEDRVVTDGAELYAGQDVTMQRGLIELAFRDTGVHVIATAPLKMKLESDQRVTLHEGQVKLVVPPQGGHASGTKDNGVVFCFGRSVVESGRVKLTTRHEDTKTGPKS